MKKERNGRERDEKKGHGAQYFKSYSTYFIFHDRTVFCRREIVALFAAVDVVGAFVTVNKSQTRLIHFMSASVHDQIEKNFYF